MIFDERADLLRGLMLLLIFRPAGLLLPASLIWPVALVSGCASACSRSRQTRNARIRGGVRALVVGRAATGDTGTRTRLYEFAIQQKMISGRFKMSAHPIHLACTEEVRQIVSGPQSFVLAQAHFERTGAAASTFLPKTFDDRPLHMVALRPPARLATPHIWRVGLQLRQLLRAAAVMRPSGLEFVFAGGVFGALVDKLKHERIVVSSRRRALDYRGRASISAPLPPGQPVCPGRPKLARLAARPRCSLSRRSRTGAIAVKLLSPLLLAAA